MSVLLVGDASVWIFVDMGRERGVRLRGQDPESSRAKNLALGGHVANITMKPFCAFNSPKYSNQQSYGLIGGLYDELDATVRVWNECVSCKWRFI